TVHTLMGSLPIFEGMIRTMNVNTASMEKAVNSDFSNATELADYLAAKGMPFREAHDVTGKLVFTCIQRGYYLKDLP
ncbi:argininosuccinate lyase, partial [Streptococcus pneumoniae]|nr:argininosuccinate lyase [Streptococcus pneumoniae]